MHIPNDETSQRRALACAHRMVARNGWDDLIFTMLTARIPGEPQHLLATPFPSLCANVTASSLVKIDQDGQTIGAGQIDVGGFPLYGAIHKARQDVNCIMHLHTTAGVAVSIMEDGLLPMSQTAMLVCDDLAYFDYHGIGQGDDEAAVALGNKNLLMLRNHGTLVVGKTVAETYGRLHVLEYACAYQVAALSSGVKLSSVDESIVADVATMGTAYLGSDVLDQAWENLVSLIDRHEPDYAR